MACLERRIPQPGNVIRSLHRPSQQWYLRHVHGDLSSNSCKTAAGWKGHLKVKGRNQGNLGRKLRITQLKRLAIFSWIWHFDLEMTLDYVSLLVACLLKCSPYRPEQIGTRITEIEPYLAELWPFPLILLWNWPLWPWTVLYLVALFLATGNPYEDE